MKTPKTATTMTGKGGGVRGHKRKQKKILRPYKMIPTSPSSSASSASTTLLFRTPSPNTTSTATATPTKHAHGSYSDYLFQHMPEVDDDPTNEYEEDDNEDENEDYMHDDEDAFGYENVTNEYEDGANDEGMHYDEDIDYDEDIYDYENDTNINGNDDDDDDDDDANIDNDNDDEDYHDEEGKDVTDDDDDDDHDISTCQCQLFFNKFDLIEYLHSKTGASLTLTVSSSYANYFLRFFQWWKSTEASNKKIHAELFKILNIIDIVLPKYVNDILEKQDGLSPKTCLNTITGTYYYWYNFS
jgi:hypothetical protein